LLKRFEDFLARNRPTDGKQRVFSFPANDPNLVPQFSLWPFHSDQHQATVTLRQNVDNVAGVNAGFLPSLRWYHHLSATVDRCMQESTLT
jgi:hypothetical protein